MSRSVSKSERAEQPSAELAVTVAMLKIVRSVNGKVVFILSGRIAAEDVAELQRLFALESEDIIWLSI